MTNIEIHRFLAAALEIYIQSARHTGRTLEVLKAANPGDVIITLTSQHAHHLHRFLKSAGENGIEVMSCPVNPANLFDQTNKRGFNAIHIDHTWIEAFYRKELDTAQRALQQFLTPKAPLEPDTPPFWTDPMSAFQLTRRNRSE